MRVELVKTGHGERVEINLGGGMIHSVTVEEALKVADWIIELCRPPVCTCDKVKFYPWEKVTNEGCPIHGKCLCPEDGHSELCPIHKVNSSPR